MKTFLIALVLLFTQSFCGNYLDTKASAEFNYRVYETPEFSTPVCMNVNNNYIKSDTPAFLLNGTTMVPARAISTALNCDDIIWNENTSSALIKKGEKIISLAKNSDYAYVDGKKVKLDSKSGIYADRFYVPVRFVAETFGCNVLWDKDTYTVDINKSGVLVPESVIGQRHYSDDDIYWLSRIYNA